MSKRDNWLYKSKFFFTIAISLLAAVGMATCAFSYSWFSNRNTMANKITGKTSGAYYASGDGSKESPYIINRPIHLYNLAWLQYMGTYNEGKLKEGTNEIQTTYFKLGSDIDMTDKKWALPPIGTEENPFVGSFDGDGHVITGLTSTNDFSEFSTKPNSVTSNNFVVPQIIGFFGVVGKLDDTYKYSYDKSTNSIHDVYLDKLTIKNVVSSSKALTGFLAGYVNGYMSKCGVYRARFNYAGETASIGKPFENISDHSIIGSYNSKEFSWEDAPGGSGTEKGFGGSIDMLSINQRLSYITAVSTISSSSSIGSVFTSDIYDTNVTLSAEDNSWNSTKQQPIIYLNQGTFMPLNIDQNASQMLDEDGKPTSKYEIKVSQNNKTFNTTEFYKNKNKEIILDTNTGYLVGGKDANGNGQIRSRINLLDSGTYRGIYMSFGKGKDDYKTNDGATYDQKQPIELLTVDSSKTVYRIEDDYNKGNTKTAFTSYSKKTYKDLNLSQYKNVVDNFNKSMQGSYMLHGFHFMNANGSEKTTTHDVQIDGTAYKNYGLMEGALNFTLSQNGTISAILGTFFANLTNSLFNLYKIERNSAGAITSIKEISKIYQDNNSNVIYQYSDSTYSSTHSNDDTLVFDFDYLADSTNKALKERWAGYYFQFPALAGDYAISANSTNKNTAYLMYLDIGSNSSGSGTGGEQPTGVISKIDFVYEIDGNIIKIDSDDYSASNVAFKISGTTNAQLVYIKRIRDEGVLYFVEPETTSLVIAPFGSGASVHSEESKSWT